MDKKTVFIKTAKGEQELSNLSGDLRRAISLIDNKSTVDEMSRRAPPSLRDDLYEVLGELVAGEYIRDKNRPAEAKIVAPKITAPKMFVPKQSTPSKSEELDFTSLASKPSFNPATASRTMGKDDEAELARAELEIAMAQSGMKPVVEDEASKEAKLRAKVAAAERARSELEAGIDAAKARASADAAAKAEAKARHEADVAARARVAAESKAMQEAANREQAEAKAKLEAAARMRAEQEAARETAKAQAALEAVAKSKAEADARVRAEIETAARARQVAEAKAKQDAEAARLKAVQEAARVKAELDAAAKAKAEAEAARIRVEQEAARVKAELEAAAKAKAEAEAARIKAEQEAARVKAELEAAKARAEAEAKALAAALAKQEAEEKARREAEEKARREAEEKARHEAEEKARHEAEEKARREAEEKARREAEEQVRLATEELARREAEAARLKAEQEAQAARVKIEQEAEAKARADAAASRDAEERIRKEVVAAAAAQEVLARANSQKHSAKSGATSSFKIDLDNFLNEEHASKDQPAPAVDLAAEAKARREAELRAAAEAKAEAEAEKISKPDVAAEMARLKAEADEARQKAEQEERRRVEERALAAEQAKAWAEAEQRAQAQAKIEAEQAVQQAALSQAKAVNKSAQRKRREPLPLGKIGFGLAVLALSAVVVLPYVYPLQEYIAPLEQRLSAQLKQPVRIGNMSAASIPPKLQLQNVTIGIEQDVQIANVVLSADMLSLFSETKVFSDVQLDDVSIKGNQLEKLAPSLKLLGGDKQFPVRHLTLQNVKVVTNEVALPSLSGVAELDGQGGFTRVALHSADEKFSVDLRPDQGRWELGVSLKETSLPLLPDIVFSDLSAKGILGDSEVNFTEMDAHIFKGILLGSARLSWRKGWQLQGRLEAKTFELDKMFPRYGIKGEMYGEGTFTLSGDKLSQLGGTRRLEASFTVKNGEIGAIDMVETARLLSRENLVGGRTRFDDLIGTVRVENGASDFRQLKIVSPMLSAGGSFDVSPTGQLSGNLNAEIKMRSGNNQMTLFGTLAEPKLRAGR